MKVVLEKNHFERG